MSCIIHKICKKWLDLILMEYTSKLKRANPPPIKEYKTKSSEAKANIWLIKPMQRKSLLRNK